MVLEYDRLFDDRAKLARTEHAAPSNALELHSPAFQEESKIPGDDTLSELQQLETSRLEKAKEDHMAKRVQPREDWNNKLRNELRNMKAEIERVERQRKERLRSQQQEQQQQQQQQQQPLQSQQSEAQIVGQSLKPQLQAQDKWCLLFESLSPLTHQPREHPHFALWNELCWLQIGMNTS